MIIIIIIFIGHQLFLHRPDSTSYNCHFKIVQGPFVPSSNLVTLPRELNPTKGKSVPLHASSDPEGSRKLRFRDFMTTAQDGGKDVSLTHRQPLLPGNAPVTHFF